MLSFFRVGKCYHFLCPEEFILCYHLMISFILCYHLMLSFGVISYFMLSFDVIIYIRLSFDVIIFCYQILLSFPPFHYPET
jgi:hypothetical protein